MVIHQNARPQKPDRVVVVGARGFIGAAICSRLEGNGIRAAALSSRDVDLAALTATERLVGLLEPSDCVVMLAALTPDKGRDSATFMKNLVMMQHVSAAVQRKGCAHFVYMSSDAVYDPAVARVTEDTPPSPKDLYGMMHYARELMAHSIAKAPVLILRVTLVYGVDDTHNSYGPNRFRRAAQKEGRITLFGGGEERRDHIHVDDVAELTVRCLLNRSVGTLNIATGTSFSFKDVASLVASQFDQEIEVVESPRATPITHRHYDVTQLIKAFPDVRFIPLAQGVARVHRESQASG